MSSIQTTEAIVLRTYNLGDADKIVLLLTLKSGVLRGVAKGARKLKSRFGAGLEPFTWINLTYRSKEDQELVSLQQLEILQAYFLVSSEPEVITDWAYLAELILALSPPHEPNPTLFALTKSCLDILARQPEARRPVRTYFGLWLLKLSGLLPSWSNCKLCQRRIFTKNVYFDRQFHFYCENCWPAPARLMNEQTYHLLAATRTNNPSGFASLAAGTEALAELEIMTQTLLMAAL